MAINGVRDYRPWSHEDEICFMMPGEVHEPYSPMPPGFSPELEGALNRIAQQDVSLTGGPRGKLPRDGGRQLNR
ncbi:MAG TPA: hypothetical protein VHS52_07040 [Acidimicrobiales bacterium]|jgi:hypothetical protein|nr:hypothetical protein [Acidimicrobiales bacterium]